MEVPNAEKVSYISLARYEIYAIKRGNFFFYFFFYIYPTIQVLLGQKKIHRIERKKKKYAFVL